MHPCRRILLAAACLLVSAAAPAAEPPDAPLPQDLVEGLSVEQASTLAAWARESFCYCGCPHTVAQCLKEHGTCKHARRMVGAAVRLVRAGAKKPDVVKMLDGYYASFDRRVKLDTASFGPALGSPSAPATLVEFSDFTCPYCQIVRPILESFVQARADRVKLVYKPFPIESHELALEKAQAAEWAREKGKFWPMHDALFAAAGARSVDELAALARRLGLDPEDLRAALEERRHVPRVRASQAEARAAGIRGTPTLFLNGRMLVLSDFSEDGLEHTLEDEEEWQQHRGWSRD